MNDIVEVPARAIVPNAGRMSVTEVVQHAKAVQEIMGAVMREGEHYGKIPGTDKPTLYKAGAEKLCMTFRIADTYRTEDLSTADCIRYRVTCIGSHQMTGTELGSGMGECSTSEEKYRWRRAVCKEEFDATPETMRRVKYARGKGGSFYTQEQVRTEPADMANTVLKMANKRAKMAMVLNVTAASDCFTQDLEDLDETLREHLADDEGGGRQSFPVRDEWIAKAMAAKTLDELSVLASSRGPAVAALQKAKDTEGYSLFVKAVQARGAVLKASQAPTPPATTQAPAAPATTPAQTTAAPAPGTDDPWMADMEAAERGANA